MTPTRRFLFQDGASVLAAGFASAGHFLLRLAGVRGCPARMTRRGEYDVLAARSSSQGTARYTNWSVTRSPAGPEDHLPARVEGEVSVPADSLVGKRAAGSDDPETGCPQKP